MQTSVGEGDLEANVATVNGLAMHELRLELPGDGQCIKVTKAWYKAPDA